MFRVSCQLISGLEKKLQNRVIPAHKNPPHDAELLELTFPFHKMVWASF